MKHLILATLLLLVPSCKSHFKLGECGVLKADNMAVTLTFRLDKLNGSVARFSVWNFYTNRWMPINSDFSSEILQSLEPLTCPTEK